MGRPLCLIAMAFLATILIFYKIRPMPIQDRSDLDGQVLLVEGSVYQKELKNQQVLIYLKVKSYTADSHEEKNDRTITDVSSESIKKLICYMDSSQINNVNAIKMGQKVIVKGTFTSFFRGTNPGGINMAQYYEILGIQGSLQMVTLDACTKGYHKWLEELFQIRLHMEGVIDQVMDEKEASIMKAMFLGNKNDLDKEVKTLYQKSGISHILVISGMHISLFGMILYTILVKTRMPHWLISLIVVVFLVNYGLMIGLGISVLRAILMYGIQLLARYLKRTYDTKTALAVASMLLLLEQPKYIYSCGFLLSFLAVMGIAMMNPVLQFLGNVKNKIILSSLGSLSVFFFTFPIMLYFFYEFPLYSLLINLLILPTTGLIMAFGVLMILGGCIHLVIGELCSIPCELSLELYEWICLFFQKLPFCNIIVGKPEEWQILFYFAIFLTVACCYKKANNWKKKGIMIVAMIGGMGMLLFRGVGENQITFLDVGQGDGACVFSEAGNVYLIDGGSTDRGKIGMYTLVPFLKYNGVHEVDYAMISHLDADHCNGIKEILEHPEWGIRIQNLVVSTTFMDDEKLIPFMELCKQRGCQLLFMKEGDQIGDKNVTFTCLHPNSLYEGEDGNSRSLVLKMRCDKVYGIFTGDVAEDGERILLQQMEASRNYAFLKVAHHGSTTSSSAPFLEKVDPELAIISCGEDNRYGHPHQEVLDRMKKVADQILITKDTGAVMLRIKGDKLWAETFLGP